MQDQHANPSAHLAPKKNHHAKTAQLTHAQAFATPSRPSLATSSGPTLTRRQFFAGAVGVIAAAALIGGVGTAVSAGSGHSQAGAGTGTLSVPENAVFTTENCEYVENTESMLTLRTRASLPYGATLTSCGDSVACCLLPTETANPLLQVGILHLGSGNLTTALKSAVSSDDGFQILDARAHGGGLVWLESNMLTGAWRVYSTTLDGARVGDPVMAAEGDASWTLPALAVSDGFAWWQTSPQDMTNASSSGQKADPARLMRIAFGGASDTAETALEVSGGFSCVPAPAGAGVTTGIRAARGSANPWELAFIADEGGVADSLALPTPMKPQDVSYGPNGFGFSFDSIYSSGGGIANLGTYVPADPIDVTVSEAQSTAREQKLSELASKSKDGTAELSASQEEEADAEGKQAVCDRYSAAEWFRFPRSPVTSPAFSGNWVFVKSTNVVAGVDLTSRKYVTIPTESATQGYGEYLATDGTAGRIVTFANVDYTPMGGQQIRECTVRVWEPVA